MLIAAGDVTFKMKNKMNKIKKGMIALGLATTLIAGANAKLPAETDIFGDDVATTQDKTQVRENLRKSFVSNKDANVCGCGDALLSFDMGANNYIGAVEIANKLGDKARVTAIAKQGISYYEGLGTSDSEQINNAVALATEIGDFEKVIELELGRYSPGSPDNWNYYSAPNFVTVASAHQMQRKAIEILKQKEAFYDIARFADEFGLTAAEKKDAYAAASDHYVKSGELMTAATVAEEGELPDKVKVIYKQILDAALEKEEFGPAALAASKLGLNSDAVDYYIRSGDYVAAAKLAEEIPNLEVAIANYEKAESYYDAGRLAEQTGQLERAIKDYVASGNNEQARTLAAKNGLERNVMEIDEKQGDYCSALSIAKKHDWKNDIARIEGIIKLGLTD